MSDLRVPDRSPKADRPGHWAHQVDALIEVLRDELGHLPYDATPDALYRADDLYSGIEGGFAATVDQAIYARAHRAGQPALAPVEELAQRLHDHGITAALQQFRLGRNLVGVMGGHALPRGSVGYRQIVALGRELTLAGFCVTTGGGPGAMEAANLGAASSLAPWDFVERLVGDLAEFPSFAEDADGFVRAGIQGVRSIPNPQVSLSVPTWFYGHEPSNPFASDIAKYFSNSEREAGLLSIADGGIVFAPGGPGTLQEVFQDAAQNAYETFGPASPMVFLDNPDDPGWWQRSGVLVALDSVFVDHHGRPRPGRDLIGLASSVTTAVELLRAGRVDI